MALIYLPHVEEALATSSLELIPESLKVCSELSYILEEHLPLALLFLYVGFKISDFARRNRSTVSRCRSGVVSKVLLGRTNWHKSRREDALADVLRVVIYTL